MGTEIWCKATGATMAPMTGPGEGSAATDREDLRAQYASGANLRSRVGIYDYLEDETAGGADFVDWVIGHVAWTGSETALDIGCGHGASLPALARRAKAVVAIDISVGMIDDARQPAIPSVVFVQADAARLALRDRRFDLVLAAFMLYHVADINEAVAEARRALRPGGSYLVTLNGARDKHELRELWAQAALNALGTDAGVPNWSERANLDNMPALLSRHFSRVGVDRRLGRFRFPDAGPPLRWMDSLRAGTEASVSDADWQAVRQAVKDMIQSRIAEKGEFVVSKDSGVIVASSPVPN